MKKLGYLVLAAGVAAALASISMVGCGDTANGTVSTTEDVVGSWIVDVTPDGDQPFKALLTFTADGGVIESEAFPLQSTGHGTWSKVGNHRYTLNFTQLQAGDLDGTYAGTATIHSIIQIDGDDYADVGGFTVDFRDPSGEIEFSGTGTAHGKRIPAGS